MFFDARPHLNPIHTLTRPAATLSHPMGEGQERILTFPAFFENTRVGISWSRHRKTEDVAAVPSPGGED
jgi:hypothetical protein